MKHHARWRGSFGPLVAINGLYIREEKAVILREILKMSPSVSDINLKSVFFCCAVRNPLWERKGRGRRKKDVFSYVLSRQK